jgi:hypothetical protein
LTLHLDTNAPVKLYADEDHAGREVDVCPDAGWMRMWRWMPRYAVNTVKKGIQRGTPKSEQEDGRVYMRLDTDQDAGGTVESAALISAKDETIAELSATTRKVGGSSLDLQPADLHHEG